MSETEELRPCPFCGNTPCCAKSVEVAKQRNHAAKENHALNMKSQQALAAQRENYEKRIKEIDRLKADNECLKLAAEDEYQKGQGKAEMKKWFQGGMGILKAENKRLREALGACDLYFQRTLASDNFMGDEEHEAWKVVMEALGGK